MSDFSTIIKDLHKEWIYDNPCILYGLIRSLKPQVVVEVGTYRGLSASWMAKALKENNAGRLYCIDNFSLLDHEVLHGPAREYLDFNLRFAGVRDWVQIIDGDSDKVTWPERISFAYLDGWHSYQAVRHDFDKCAAAGAECICLDDAEQSVGPRMVVQELRASGYWDVLNVHRDCGMAVCMRRIKMGPVTFSQEDPTSPGLDLQTVSKAEQLKHLDDMGRVNGVDYGPVLAHLHPGKR